MQDILRHPSRRFLSTHAVPVARPSGACRRSVPGRATRLLRRGLLPALALASTACATSRSAEMRAPLVFEIENQTWETRSIYLFAETGARVRLGQVAGQSTRRLAAPPHFLDTHLELRAVVERRGSVVLASRGSALAAPYAEATAYATVPFLHEGRRVRRWRIEQGRLLANVR